MKVLIDTNILIYYFSKNPMFYDDARKIMFLCTEKKIDCCIAAHSVMNTFYILRKEFTTEERKSMLTDICNIMTVVGIDKEKIIDSLQNDYFSDVEDCLQTECAKEFSADCIITQNIKHFKNSEVPAILPNDFLKKYA
ncbi:MAG: PIN domain-containing protein [Oscillospiraceae bacterium]|nr:PIN domain-containing protein [Oscillospiraceae bacterium]